MKVHVKDFYTVYIIVYKIREVALKLSKVKRIESISAVALLLLNMNAVLAADVGSYENLALNWIATETQIRQLIEEAEETLQ